MQTILLDNKEVENLVPESLPMLIHGSEGSGASLYTICLTAKWFSQGYKILFLCGYPRAEKEFAKEVNRNYPNVTFFTKEKASDFLTALNSAQNNTIVIIKNIELFDKRVFDVVGKINKLIISGDINKVSFKDELLKNNFSTKVYFNSLDGKEVHQLEKFQGLIVADDLEGVTQIL